MVGINPQVAEDTKQLCTDWLINHIKYSDRALGMYLKHKLEGYILFPRLKKFSSSMSALF